MTPADWSIVSVPLNLREQIDAFQRAVIEGALFRHAGNVTQTAKALGISRQGLYKKMHRFGIATWREGR